MAKKNTAPPSASAVIAAAGCGSRMNSKSNKQFILLDGIPILAYTLLQFCKAETVSEIIIAAQNEDILTVNDLVRDFGISKVRAVVPGGSTRQESVSCGLARVTGEITLVHDGARPFVSVEAINSAVYAADKYGAAALGVPLKDTAKLVSADNTIISTPERSSLRLVQTPQAFRTGLIQRAYSHAAETGFAGTDDCSVAEHYGIPVKIIDGEYTNIKITTPEDIPVAEAILGFLQNT